MRDGLRWRPGLILMAAVGLVMTGCSSQNAKPAEPVSACLVTQTGAVTDSGFNEQAWSGIQRAHDELGVETAYLESRTPADYAPNVNAMISRNCTVIVTLGFALAETTKAAANSHPNTDFSIVDYAFGDGEITHNNVLGQVFSVEQASFLAGYLAAGTTRTGTVGAFGGMDIPPVRAYLNGYYYGVQKYNADNKASIQVVGWNPTTGKGLFTGNFDNESDGGRLARKLLNSGADIVMPVGGGPAQLGAAKVAAAVGPNALMIIGVDTDQYEDDPARRAVYLTSVLKNSNVTTFDAVSSVAKGDFSGGVVTGTLANGGVGLAQVHAADGRVPPALTERIARLQQEVIDGVQPVDQ